MSYVCDPASNYLHPRPSCFGPLDRCALGCVLPSQHAGPCVSSLRDPGVVLGPLFLGLFDGSTYPVETYTVTYE